MMSNTKVTEFKLDNGETIAVEIAEPNDSSYKRVGRGRADDKELQTFRGAIARLQPATNELFSAMQNLVSEPKSVEVEFGVKMNVKAGVLIASTSGEANFKVKLTWERENKASSAADAGTGDPAGQR